LHLCVQITHGSMGSPERASKKLRPEGMKYPSGLKLNQEVI